MGRQSGQIVLGVEQGHNFIQTKRSDCVYDTRVIDFASQELYRELIYDGINVDVMHAERSAAQREEVIRRFRAGEIWVLICTDLMARGESPGVLMNVAGFLLA